MSKSRDIADSAATINYIDGLTSDAQGQIDTATSDIATNASDIATKAPLSNPTFTGTVTATAFSGDGSGLTGVDSLPSQTGNSGKFLTTNGTASAWDAVDVSSEITGTLPIANGGTGTTATTFVNLATNVTGTLPVAKGGTGATSLTANNVLLGNGTSAPQAVAPSTAGNVLTSNGSTWQSTAPAGGGAWSLLATVSASASSYATFDGYFSSTYTNYVLIGEGIYTGDAGNDCHLAMQVKVNSTWKTNQEYLSVANKVWNIGGSGYQAVWEPNFDTGFLLIQDLNQSTTALGSASLECTIFAPALTVMANRVHFKSSTGYSPYSSQGDRVYAYNGVGQWANTDAINGIRLFPKSGNITGTFRLYGIKNS